MASMAPQETDSKEKIQQLRMEFQLMIEVEKALMMKDMREIMGVFKKNNGRVVHH